MYILCKQYIYIYEADCCNPHFFQVSECTPLSVTFCKHKLLVDHNVYSCYSLFKVQS